MIVAPSVQRRRAVRRAVQLEAEVSCALWEDAVTMRVRDLSPYGVWLETELALAVGDTLRLRWPAPQGSGFENFEAEARVARVSLAPTCQKCGQKAGMGLSFTHISDVAQRELEHGL